VTTNRHHSSWLRALLLLGLAVVLAGTTAACAKARSAAGTSVSSPTPPAASPSPSSTIAAFHTSGYLPQQVDGPHQLYGSGSDVTLPDAEPHDATGVRMYLIGGRMYDHPVAQAQYGLALLTSYQRHHDPALLALALKQAGRIIAHRTVAKGAWFYPYPFGFALHNNPKEMERAPWYSGMAQAQALSLFVRLAVVTGDPRWQQAAAATFDSFLAPPSDGAPWVAHVDNAGYLWIDEYPERPAPASDLTYNGQMFGVVGLYDFVHYPSAAARRRLPIALQMLDGAETTAEHYASVIRNPGFVSRYCLQDGTLNAQYHAIHVVQLSHLYTLTQDQAFARAADDLRRDYPTPEVTGTIHVIPGTYQLARFDAASGRQIASTQLTLGRGTTLPTLYRQRILGQGIWLKIGEGPYKDWWVKERAGRVWLGGVSAAVSYWPARPIGVDGSVTSYVLDQAGRAVGTKTARLAHATVLVDQTADVNGRESWHVVSGPLAGTWLPVTRP